MSLKLLIAQILNCELSTCIHWISNRAYVFDDLYLLFLTHETSTSSISRWHVIFRIKEPPPRSIIKKDFSGQGFVFSDELFSTEAFLMNFETPINDSNEALQIKNVLGNDFKMGFVEITPISQDTTQLLLFIDDGLDTRFLDPFFHDLSKLIVPTRKITQMIDPTISPSLQETMNENQHVDNREATEEKRVEVSAYPYDGLNKSLFPNEEIEPHDFKGQGKFDDIYIHFYFKKKYTAIMVSRLLKNKEIYRAPETIYNRTSKLRKMHGEEIIPSKITKHN